MSEQTQKELEMKIDAHNVEVERAKVLLRDNISLLEDELKQMEQVAIPVHHHFSKDVYAREMRMPADTVVIGKIHKHQNLNILSSGEVSILSIDGVIKVKAPYTFVGSPGAKRVIYAHTDAVWTVIHGSAETDLEKLEEEFIAKNYGEVVVLTAEELKALKGDV